MNKLILCEGKIDAILLGYYFGKEDWKKCQTAPKGLEIKTDVDNQSTTWYKKGKDFLLICAVGGKGNFKNFFENKIEKPLRCSIAPFERIAIVRDRDDEQIQNIEAKINNALQTVSATVHNRQWSVCRYRNEYGEEESLKILLVVIPREKQGALESLMLKAIAEDEEVRKIVDKARGFTEQMKQASHIDEKMKDKACLRVVWAVQYPDQTSMSFVEQIQKIPWEKTKAFQSCFSELIKI